MRQLSRRHRRAALALAVVAILFCALDVAGAPFAGARSGTQGFFGALYRGTDSVVGPPRRWLQALPQVGSQERRIDRLNRQLQQAQRSAAAEAQNAATSAAVSALQLQANRGGYRVLPARVTALGPGGGFDWTVVLDVGSSDGARVGQSVLAGPALVGRVIRVSDSSTTVLLAADPKSGVGVRDSRSGEIGVVTGHGTKGFTYAPLDPAAVPKAGDQLTTGPVGATSYIAGLTVGTVTSVTASADGSSVATVSPAEPPTTLDLLGVVLVGGQNPLRPPLVPGAVPGAGPGAAPTAHANGPATR